MKIFVDSDVMISSLLSSNGASHQLLVTQDIDLYISTISHKELQVVIERLHIEEQKLGQLIKDYLQIVKLNERIGKLKKTYGKYVRDSNDSHIVAGAKQASVQFLITYNIRDFKIDKIIDDLHIIILTPGMFLQFLRSR